MVDNYTEKKTEIKKTLRETQTLAVVRRSQKISSRRRPPSRRRGTAKI